MYNIVEAETRHYWNAARALRAEMQKSRPDFSQMEDWMSEIEAVLLHTERPIMRSRCSDVLEEMTGGVTQAVAVP